MSLANEGTRPGRRGFVVEDCLQNWYLESTMEIRSSVGVLVDRSRILPESVEEAALVAELQTGCEEAFVYLLAVYQNPVFNMISHILGNDSDAADVLQDVFFKVFRGIHQFHGESSLKTWIYRIAVHEASNHRRSWLRRHRREPVSLDEVPAESAVACAECRASADTPYQVLEQSERQNLVQQALASLAQPYRSVVVLRAIEGLSYEEIAQVLGVPEGTVKSRLLRGRELLRRKLANVLAR